MRRLITEWNIQSRGHGCAACGRSFADKEAYHTVLLDARSEFARSDLCADCWRTRFADVRSRPDFISCWQGVYTAPPPPEEAIKKETAETLLRKLVELNDPKYIPAGFILAAMLERKRLLKVKEQLVRDGRRVFVYEQPSTGDVFTIIDPGLKLDEWEQVHQEVTHLLEHGIPQPAASQPENHTSEPASDAAPSAEAAAVTDGDIGAVASVQ